MLQACEESQKIHSAQFNKVDLCTTYISEVAKLTIGCYVIHDFIRRCFFIFRPMINPFLWDVSIPFVVYIFYLYIVRQLIKIRYLKKFLFKSIFVVQSFYL